MLPDILDEAADEVRVEGGVRRGVHEAVVVGQHDDRRLDLAGADEVVHNVGEVAVGGPVCLGTAAAGGQVERRVWLWPLRGVVGRGIDGGTVLSQPGPVGWCGGWC